MRCTGCGKELPAAAAACPACGAPAAVAAVPTGAKLVISKAPEDSGIIGGLGRTLMDVGASGKETHSIFPIEKPAITIGRIDGNDVQLSHTTVSKQHARVFVDGGAFWIEDVGSVNGTLVNDQDVKRQKLASNDRIKIGKFCLVFVWPQAKH